MKKEIKTRIQRELMSLGVRGTVTTRPRGRHSTILLIHMGARDIMVPLSNTLGTNDRQWKNFRSQIRNLVNDARSSLPQATKTRG